MKWEAKKIQRPSLLDGNYHRKIFPTPSGCWESQYSFPIRIFFLFFLYFQKKIIQLLKKNQVKLWEIFYGPLFKNNDLTTTKKTVLVCWLYKAQCKLLYAHKKIDAGMGLLWPCRSCIYFILLKKTIVKMIIITQKLKPSVMF